MTTTATRIVVVHECVHSSRLRAQRDAEKALLDGVETVLHAHSTVNPHGPKHYTCEFYVLDWHDEPEYDGIRQIAVIHCEPEEVPHA